MNKKAMQDFYPENFSHCYGCGRLSENGLHIKTYWNGKEGICSFIPQSDQISMHGFAYGGLIASVIDCNGTATAAAATYQAQGREPGSEPAVRFVTASLHVDYLKPTPVDGPLELKSYVKEMNDRRVTVLTELSVKGVLCAKGEVVAARVPSTMESRGK